MKANRRFGVCDILLMLSALAFLLGLLFVFFPCGAKEDGGWMSCHWAGQALKGVAALELVLALQNIRRKPLSSVTLMLLAAYLAFSVFAGSLVVMSLRNGLKGYEARLGADVVVVPAEAGLKGGLESILLQGVPGYFYMNESVVKKISVMEKISAMDGA